MSASTLLTSVVTGGSASHATVAEEANTYATDFVSNGVVGTFGVNLGSGGTGSFCVNADASPDMGVTIKAGQAYVTATPSGQNSQTLRVRAAADYTTYTINANSSGSTKYDWIYLSISATNANTPSSDGSNVASFVTSRSSSNTADNGSPPTYGLLLAIVTVANGASSITNSTILDKRVQASVSTAGTSSNTGWVTGLTVPTTVAANGNRSYTLTVNGTDLTGTVSAGMRLRTTRLVAAPTQCTSLNGTTQYYSKTAPAGFSYTDTFSVLAQVKLAGYNGADNYIFSRYLSNGSFLRINSSGQVIIYGEGSGSTRTTTSYQSVPLNKWVHIAATLQMSTGVGHIYIDGIDVPVSTAGAGTAIVQAGNLFIGALSSGPSGYFNGKLAQVAIFSSVLSQATIQSYISQGLAGTETSLISAYSFNNSINDLNANANNLTANGSALATNADSPFGGQADGSISSTLDYGIITKAVFSTNTTLTVQVPEGCTIPTSGGVSAVSYATVKAPYGMPVDANKWRVDTIVNTAFAKSAPVSGTLYYSSFQLGVPVGAWKLSHAFALFFSGANGSAEGTLASSTAATLSAETDYDLTARYYTTATASTTGVSMYRWKNINLSAATTYSAYLFSASGISGTSIIYQSANANSGPIVISAELAYL